MTLKLLHGEYVDTCRAEGSTAMGYDRFCKTYQRHVLVSGAASRVGHKAGQTVEVDWSGPTMQLTDPVTGAATRVFLFVGCLPFSRYAFVEPTLDMRQDTWLRAHVAMFDWFGGSVPRVVPDNLKTGVIKHPAEGEVVLNDGVIARDPLHQEPCGATGERRPATFLVDKNFIPFDDTCGWYASHQVGLGGVSTSAGTMDALGASWSARRTAPDTVTYYVCG